MRLLVLLPVVAGVVATATTGAGRGGTASQLIHEESVGFIDHRHRVARCPSGNPMLPLTEWWPWLTVWVVTVGFPNALRHQHIGWWRYSHAWPLPHETAPRSSLCHVSRGVLYCAVAARCAAEVGVADGLQPSAVYSASRFHVMLMFTYFKMWSRLFDKYHTR